MSFEQLEHQEHEQKKKKKLEKEKNEQFFLERQVHDESSQLLQKLASEIAREFWIDISQAKNLLGGKAQENLSPSLFSLNTVQQQKLDEAVYKAKEALRLQSKEVRESLKKTLEFENRFDDVPGKLVKKLFSQELLKRWIYPQSITDQALWSILGLLDSSEAVILFLYGLGKWVLLTPYHLYLIITGKANYDGWKKI